MLYGGNFWWRRTTLLTCSCLSLLVGLALARRGYYVPIWIAASCGALTIIGYRKAGLRLVLLTFCSCILGMWRGHATIVRLYQYDQVFNKKVVITGTAASDAVYGQQSQLTFDVSDLRYQGHSLIGKLGVSGFGAPMVYKGDIVEVGGKLRPARGSLQGRISFAQFTILQKGTNPIDRLRRNFAAGMQNALPEPLASFGMGLLIGQKATLPQITSDQLSTVGLTHLIAVSGYNLTILIEAARRILGKRSKYQTAVISLLLMGVFLLLAGSSASIVRAALVSSLSLLAWYYGRQLKPLLLITLAAALTAWLSPLYLWSDIGWYLSFLAFFGVIVISPVLTKRLYGVRKPPTLVALIIETISAQLPTVPYIMYIFGRVSLISLVANILTVPLIPLAMLLATIAGTAGMIAPMLSGWVAWPARLLLTYILDVVSILSRVPHALASYSMTFTALLGCYGIVLSVTWLLWFKDRPKYGRITDKKS